MKFLEHLKQFNKAVLEENAKLKGIYEQLISEAKAENIKVDEDDIKENDLLKNKPHNAHISESDKEEGIKGCGEKENTTTEDNTNEADNSFNGDEITPAEVFFNDSENVEDQIPEEEFMEACKGDGCGNKEDIIEAEDPEIDEADDLVPSVEEFFNPNAKVTTSEKEIEESENTEEIKEDDSDLMSYEEFFQDSESEKNSTENKEDQVKEAECPKCGKDPCICEKDVTDKDFLEDSEDDDNEKNEDKKDQSKDKEAKKTKSENDEVKESEDPEIEENDKLDESLEPYRKMNARLFRD